jgi:polysaccharide export outer membrane protein
VTTPGCARAPVQEAPSATTEGDRQARHELEAGLSAFDHGAYDQAIGAFQQVIERYPGTPLLHNAQWMLAKSYELKGDIAGALQEYRLFLRHFPESEHGNEAAERVKSLEQRLLGQAERVRRDAVPGSDYRIGEEDELEISVYGEDDLFKTQTVRPDGKLAFPLVGEIRASGLTPDELKGELTSRLSAYVNNPRVTVIITQYNSKHVVILGEVRTPGLVRLMSDLTVLKGISRVGGVTEDADLLGALLIRNGEILAVNFERLLRRGDFSQNPLLQPNDTILIPNASAKKVFVLGEVNKPQVVPLRSDTTLVEAISMAGGFTRDAQPKSVLVVSGGLGDPNPTTVNVEAIAKKGEVVRNIHLRPGDIVYVPRTVIADVDRFFEHLKTILTPIVLAETGIVLYPDVQSVLTKGTTSGKQPVFVGP